MCCDAVGFRMAPVMPRRDSRARAAQALQLRGRRKSWQEIADELGFRSRGGAQMAVNRLVKAVAADPGQGEFERAVSAASLQQQETGLFGLFESAVQQKNSESAAHLSRELRSLVTDRAKLTGIAAPSAVSVDVNLTVGQMIAQARRRLLALDHTVDAEVIE